uniref:Uncharacterized protein n=1 Tax=Chlamydomonas euryale TaxID=1486919 RepID=A0A6U2FDP2_9CHLO|mmetsp:Transcript_28075/g.83173  ORF Transcript_28075/g.83173 Transcript_28075/m.83173 type:complete len:301 (+) Transcript_28075:1563-2465(+)
MYVLHVPKCASVPFCYPAGRYVILGPATAYQTHMTKKQRLIESAGQGLPVALCPAPIQQELALPSGFVCRPFATTHTVPSQGYVLYSQRKRLRAELQGRSQEEIRDARLAGQDVTEQFEVPEVAFTGDTTAAFLDEPAGLPPTAVHETTFPDSDIVMSSVQSAVAMPSPEPTNEDGGDVLPLSTNADVTAPQADGSVQAAAGRAATRSQEVSLLEDVLRAKLLIMELTFLDDSVSVEQARGKGHMHIADFVANAHRFQNEAILLVHFSARYNRKQIVEALNTWLPPALRAKCVPFLNGIP